MKNFKKEYKMKQILLTAILSLMIGCKGQNNNSIITNIKKDTMEYMDKKKYFENVKPEGYIFTRPNGEIVTQTENEDHTFDEQIKILNSPYHIYKEFHTNTTLKSKTTEFYTFPIGITKEYNENGKLIKETNWEKDYSFSVEDLVKKIKSEFGIDLIQDYRDKKSTQMIVIRQGPFPVTNSYYPINTAFYRVKFLDKNNKTVLLDISGKDGNIITEIINQEYIIPKGYIPSKTTSNPNSQNKSTSSNFYKTHEGKSYTKAQWEAYEEKQWEEYCKRTGRTYTPKKQEPGIKSQEPTAKSQEPRAENQAKKSKFLAEDWEHGDAYSPQKDKGFWDKLFG